MNRLTVIQQRLGPQLAEMDSIIRESLRTSNPLMNQVVSNYLSVKGKQIRPLMVILSAGLFGCISSNTLHAGAALEMLHNASLIHDDVVDETLLRRSQPTVNAREGNHVAVLVGDYFVSNALAAGIKTGDISIVKALSDLGKELSLGEIDQICNVRDRSFDKTRYFSVISKKTASLFMHCARMGAQTAGATPQQYEPLVGFANLLGLCFQIKDDILDYVGTEAIGKPRGNDLREGKVTLPLLHALTTVGADEADKAKNLISCGDLSDEEIASLIDLAVANGGIEYAQGQMEEMYDRGAELLSAYPDSIWKESLLDLFRFIISRDN